MHVRGRQSEDCDLSCGLSYHCVGKQEGFGYRISEAKVLTSLAERIRLGGFHLWQDKQMERGVQKQNKADRLLVVTASQK